MEDRNCCQNIEKDDKMSGIETACMNEKCNCDDDMEDYNSCECGFDQNENTLFPSNPMLGQSYVPIQKMGKTFTPCCGLKRGTIFPELVSTYYPGQGMMEIDYLKARNNIGEGCNNVLE